MEIKQNITIKANVIATFRNKEGQITHREERHNLVPTVGLESIASRLSGTDNPSTIATITYCALGTGTNVPAAGDTALQTEVFRKQISVRDYDGVTARFRTFFSTSEGNATLKECGLFGDDATATTDSGILFARVNIDKAKTDAETLTLDWEITISDTTV
jgi:hypothetical protein